MSKSKGNFFTIPDVLARRGTSPTRSATCCSPAHYRKQLNFTWEGLQQAAAALERIHGFAAAAGARSTATGPVAPAVEAGVHEGAGAPSTPRSATT